MAELTDKPIVIITGSNGFIGQAITKRLTPRYNVIGLDQKISKKSAGSENYKINISSSESISNALEEIRDKHGSRIASVVHLAAYYSFSEERSPQYQKVTVKGTEKFLNLLKDFEVGQFIFSSTMLVHKPVKKGEKISETSPINPAWAYPESKVAAEKILKSQHAGIPLVNLRLAGVYDDHGHSIPISNQIMRIYEKHLSSHLFPGDSSKGQAFLHLDDLVDAIDKLIEKRQNLPHQLDLLLGEPEAMSYDELQDDIGRLLYRHEWDTLKVPSWFAKLGSWLQHQIPFVRKPFIKPWMIDFADDHYDLDITKAQELLKWKPRHELRKTLPLIIETLTTNPQRWYEENKLEMPNRLGEHFEVPSAIYVTQLNALNLMNILWGLWLISDSITRTSSSAMILSEIISGLSVIIFSSLALWTLWQWPRWAAASVGTWILFAPLAFWAESPAAYSTGNIVGLLVVICGSFQPARQYFSVASASDNPPGWDYNPSAWGQRVPVITLAFIGFFIARYMAAFQLGHTSSVWDPIFGGQTETTLTSDISKKFPVSDAGLGAFSYLLDAVSGIIGDRRRWKTMPWMVILFGLMIIPPGVTSIALIILQPVGVGAWCFLCLLTALIMLVMVAPALDEIVATVQFLLQSHKQKKPFWQTFLRGEPISADELPPAAPVEIAKKSKPALPVGLVICIIIGSWLMLLPAVFTIAKPASNLVYFSSALILTFSIIALSEIARPARFLNIIISVALVVGIWILTGSTSETKWIVSLSSIAIITLSIPKGKFRSHFGSYDKLARWSPFNKTSIQ